MDQFENHNRAPMSVKDWLLTMLLVAIPVVGLIMLCIWAFGTNENPNRQNWAKAYLIFMLVAVIFAIFFCFLFWGIFAAAMAGSNAENF